MNKFMSFAFSALGEGWTFLSPHVVRVAHRRAAIINKRAVSEMSSSFIFLSTPIRRAAQTHLQRRANNFICGARLAERVSEWQDPHSRAHFFSLCVRLICTPRGWIADFSLSFGGRNPTNRLVNCTSSQVSCAPPALLRSARPLTWERQEKYKVYTEKMLFVAPGRGLWEKERTFYFLGNLWRN